MSNPALPTLPADGRLRVWAPDAGTVELQPGGPITIEKPVALTRDEDLAAAGRPGWWVTDGTVAPGTEYAYRVDGSDPRPDPRSAWQPHGVHGPSRTFDTGAFAWTDGEWRGVDVLGAVTYELHIGTFTPGGTLDSAIERLGHLRDLGVDLVELMPVAAFPGERGWGYDGVSLYAVHEAYGGPEALQRFVDAAHGMGMGVCLDVVYNHLGPAGNYLPVFGPYFTDEHETPWGWAVNLDQDGAAEVRAFVVDNALRWLRDFHVDALRLDAVHALVDESEAHLLSDLSEAVAALADEVGRPLGLVAESDLNDAAMVTPVAEGGLGMDGQWDDDLHHALHALLTGERHGYYVDFGAPEALRTVLEEVFLHAGTHSTFRGVTWGAPVADDVDRRRFVVCSQNHDQVGNRALGDRPSRVLDDGQLVAAAAIVLLGPFSPMLFQGEEWGTKRPFQYFTDHDPELGQLVSAGRRNEFAGHGWEKMYGESVDVPDPQARSTYLDSRVPWAEIDNPDHPDSRRHHQILTAYRALIGLLKSEPDLASGAADATAVEIGEHGSWLRMRRGSIDVLLVLSAAAQLVPVPAEDRTDATELLFAFGEDAASTVELGSEGVLLPGHGVAVLRR